jgi:hypothetical protein
MKRGTTTNAQNGVVTFEKGSGNKCKEASNNKHNKKNNCNQKKKRVEKLSLDYKS